VPSLAEATGLSYEAAAWIGYAAPPGTPREVLTRLSSEIRKILGTDELKDRFLALGMDTASSTPEEMAAFMRREQERYGTIIRNANIKVE
jgi:tripartite-type tricarboxylate transporter receptor subunit TctC